MAKYQSNAQPLRSALVVNGLFSAFTGAICLLASEAVSGWLFVDAPFVFGMPAYAHIAATGGCLLLFAAFVLYSAASKILVPGLIKLITALDAGWVVASAILLPLSAAHWTSAGLLMATLVAIIVAFLAIEQVIGLSLLYQGESEIRVQRQGDHMTLIAAARTRANPSRVWQVMSDMEGYADVADNLSKVEVISGEGTDMKRRCFDTSGKGWEETCTRWEEGRAFAFRVHTDAPDYPYPIAQLNGEWSLTPLEGGTDIEMRFEVTAKPGILNGLAFRLMAAPFSKICNRLLSKWIAQMERADHAANSEETRTGEAVPQSA